MNAARKVAPEGAPVSRVYDSKPEVITLDLALYALQESHPNPGDLAEDLLADVEAGLEVLKLATLAFGWDNGDSTGPYSTRSEHLRTFVHGLLRRQRLARHLLTGADIEDKSALSAVDGAAT